MLIKKTENGAFEGSIQFMNNKIIGIIIYENGILGRITRVKSWI